MTAKERLEVIKEQLDSGKYDFVINAGDPDQEGELLIRIVLEYLHNRLPVKRFWTNDLTEAHILDALKNLKDDDNDPMCVNLYAAAKGRQHSDYRFGMNLSEASSLKMEIRSAVGRVKTPILATVCKREKEILNFKPKTTYGLQSNYTEKFTGILFNQAAASKDEDADEDAKNGTVWFDSKTEAMAVMAGLPDKAKVITFDKSRTETYAPKLYKLATLQIDAGKRGFNDAKTLQIIQGLYEKEYLSYPRTDCEYLSSNENFTGILKAVSGIASLEPYTKAITRSEIEKVRKTKKWINDKALEDAGHSAIRPTTKPIDPDDLTAEELDIYTMVCKRFIAMFLPPVVQYKTTMVAEAGGHTFKSTGKTLVDPGYSVIFGTKFTDMVIPEKKAGDIIDVKNYTITEKTTTCPKRYTSPGLIEVCENPAKFLDDPSLKALGKRLKIGTPATRSSIIRQLIEKDGYMAEKKEKKTTYIVPTKVGMDIIENLGECDICKVDLTGMWEEQLEDVRQGKTSLEKFEMGMIQQVEEMIEDIKKRDMKRLKAPRYSVIGTCPKCGKELCEGSKGYFCLGFRDNPKCGVGAYKEFLGTSITAQDFLDMTEGKEVVKTLKSPKGKSTWKQRLRYDIDTCEIKFVDGEDEKIGTCPKCGGDILMNDRSFKCTGDDVSGYRTLLGATFNRDEIMTMLNGGKVRKTLKKGRNKWDQDLTYNFEEKRFAFLQPEKHESGLTCPECGKPLQEDEKTLTCSCGVCLWKNFFGHALTKEEMEEIFRDGQTAKSIDGLKAKSGSLFSARAGYNKDEKRFVPIFEQRR